MTKKMEKTFNEQMNAELYSAYLYLAMAAYFDNLNLEGFANWMRVQVQEELVHVMKFFNFVRDRRGRVALEAIGKPPKDWKSPREALEAAFKHEQMITGRINDLVAIALVEKDNAAYSFLQWFVTEQVEEEASVDRVIQKLKLSGAQGAGMFMIDQELAARVFVAPPAGA